MIKWVPAAISSSVPALVGERSIQVAGHSAARRVSQTDPGGPRREAEAGRVLGRARDRGGVKAAERRPQWRKFGALPPPLPDREPRAGGRGGFGPLMNQEQKEPLE